MVTGFGFIVIREVERTEEVFQIMATFQISPPQSFNFAQSDEWLRWICCFERF